jgi:hypothetical protein
LLACFLASSTGWWINVAEAQTTSSSNRDNFGQRGGFGGPGGGGPGNETVSNKNLVQYLEENQGDYKFMVAVSGSNAAAPIIIQTGKAVMSIGGFLGNARTITSTAQLQQMIDDHVVRYFLNGSGGMDRGQNSVVNQYVQQNCKVVDSNLYSASPSSSSNSNSNQFGRNSFGNEQLYVCGS